MYAYFDYFDIDVASGGLFHCSFTLCSQSRTTSVFNVFRTSNSGELQNLNDSPLIHGRPKDCFSRGGTNGGFFLEWPRIFPGAVKMLVLFYPF